MDDVEGGGEAFFLALREAGLGGGGSCFDSFADAGRGVTFVFFFLVSSPLATSSSSAFRFWGGEEALVELRVFGRAISSEDKLST